MNRGVPLKRPIHIVQRLIFFDFMVNELVESIVCVHYARFLNHILVGTPVTVEIVGLELIALGFKLETLMFVFSLPTQLQTM